MPAITITVISGPAAGATVTKEPDKKFSLGRIKTGNALPLQDETVSSKHLLLFFSEGSWFAEDQNSSNGSRLNDSEANMLQGPGLTPSNRDSSDKGIKHVCLPGPLHAYQACMLLVGQAYKLRCGDSLHIGLRTTVQVQFQEACEDDDITVEEKLTADVERLAASLKAAAAASVQQIRQDWAEKRAALLHGLVQS